MKRQPFATKDRLYYRAGMEYKVGYLGKIFRMDSHGDWILSQLNAEYQIEYAKKKLSVSAFFRKTQIAGERRH